MAQMMNAEQREKTLEAYNPVEKLIPVGKNKDGSKVMYYPAAWRLYELHLRYPNANFKSEIIYHDTAKGTVIVKAYLYLGASYESSDKKAEAMKQGSIATLDKVETAAKARCARDFGIGTEYALDMEPDETDARHTQETSSAQQTQRSTTQSTNTSANKEPANIGGEHIPTGSQLQTWVNSLNWKWEEVIKRAFAKVSNANIPAILALGSDLSPTHCKRVDAYIKYALSQEKQAS